MTQRDGRFENNSKLNGRNKSTGTEMMNGKIWGNNEKKKNTYTIYKIITSKYLEYKETETKIR